MFKLNLPYSVYEANNLVGLYSFRVWYHLMDDKNLQVIAFEFSVEIIPFIGLDDSKELEDTE